MLTLKKRAALVLAMQRNAEGLADTFAKIAGKPEVLQIKRDLSNVQPEYIRDAVKALRYDAEADALRKVYLLLTDNNYFSVLSEIYMKNDRKEAKK